MDVLAGFDTFDDAGVYRLGPNQALVQTVDFFTPIVDDPLTYGQITAVNSVSDIYAMGGRPITALSVVAFPKSGVDLTILRDMMRGGISKLEEAGVALLGGHSVADPEIKFGFAVTGLIDPERIIRNAGARAGDLLVLTKPIGTGVIATAIKFQKADDAVIAEATRSMLVLNRAAAEIMQEIGVHAATDVTGFGLVGHAVEMAQASGITLRITVDRVPLLPGALHLAGNRKLIPGGTATNRSHFGSHVVFERRVPDPVDNLLFDPQTAGGLLISVGEDKIEALMERMHVAAVPAVLIGQVQSRGSHAIVFE